MPKKNGGIGPYNAHRHQTCTHTHTYEIYNTKNSGIGVAETGTGIEQSNKTVRGVNIGRNFGWINGVAYPYKTQSEICITITEYSTKKNKNKTNQNLIYGRTFLDKFLQ